MSRRCLRPIQTPIYWVPGALSTGVKRPQREADQATPRFRMTESSVCTTRPSIRINYVHKNNFVLCCYFPIHSVVVRTAKLREYDNIVIKMGNERTRFVQSCLCGVECLGYVSNCWHITVNGSNIGIFMVCEAWNPTLTTEWNKKNVKRWEISIQEN